MHLRKLTCLLCDVFFKSKLLLSHCQNAFVDGALADQLYDVYIPMGAGEKKSVN